MKTQKLLVIAAIVCLLVGASGAAMAQDICEGGIIQDRTFDSLTLVGQSCYIIGVTVSGDLTIIDAGKISIQNSDVGGTIRVEASGEVQVSDSKAGRVIVRGNESVDVALMIANRAIRVIRNNVAYVVLNAAPIINCRGNIRWIGKENLSSSGNNCDRVL